MIIYSVILVLLFGGAFFISLVMIPEEYRIGKAGMLRPIETNRPADDQAASQPSGKQ